MYKRDVRPRRRSPSCRVGLRRKDQQQVLTNYFQTKRTSTGCAKPKLQELNMCRQTSSDVIMPNASFARSSCASCCPSSSPSSSPPPTSSVTPALFLCLFRTARSLGSGSIAARTVAAISGHGASIEGNCVRKFSILFARTLELRQAEGAKNKRRRRWGARRLTPTCWVVVSLPSQSFVSLSSSSMLPKSTRNVRRKKQTRGS